MVIFPVVNDYVSFDHVFVVSFFAVDKQVIVLFHHYGYGMGGIKTDAVNVKFFNEGRY